LLLSNKAIDVEYRQFLLDADNEEEGEDELDGNELRDMSVEELLDVSADLSLAELNASTGNEPLYVVEKVISERCYNGEKKIRVRWEGGVTTLEPCSDIKVAESIRSTVAYQEYILGKKRKKNTNTSRDTSGRISSGTLQ
jgi:hypothetical protein